MTKHYGPRVIVLLTMILLEVVFGRLSFSCTMILCGKQTTVGGSVLLAHNNDLSPDIASLLQILPRQTFPPGSLITLKNGLSIPWSGTTQKLLMLICHYGFTQGDAVAINQYQVCVAGGVALKDDRNIRAERHDPLIKMGVTGHIRYLALQKAKTARECVQIIGDMYSRYGISYPSGVGIADPGEIWYMEAGGGKSWVAVRIPQNCYLAVANGYRIGYVNFRDSRNFIFPPYLKKFLIQKKLWNPAAGPFHFARTFGQNRIRQRDYYNTRRIWRIQQLLSPGLKQRPDLREYPFILPPDAKISLKKLFTLLRDHYQESPFDRRIKRNRGERTISTINTVHTKVIQLRSQLPENIGAVLWAGLGPARMTAYTPYYLGISEIHESFRKATSGYDKDSAFWAYRTLAALAESCNGSVKDQITRRFAEYEEELLAGQSALERQALQLGRRSPRRVNKLLTGYCIKCASKSLALAVKMRRMLSKKKGKITP